MFAYENCPCEMGLECTKCGDGETRCVDPNDLNSVAACDNA